MTTFPQFLLARVFTSGSVTRLATQLATLIMFAFPSTFLLTGYTSLATLILTFAMNAFILALLFTGWAVLGTRRLAAVAAEQCPATSCFAGLMETSMKACAAGS